MAEFSISDAALTGFRVVREHPRAVLVWAAFQLVFSLLLQTLVLATATPGMMAVFANPQAIDPAQAAALLGQMLRLLVVVLPFALGFYAILLAAMNRVVLRPDESRFGYLRVGPDEVRQLALIALSSLVVFGIEVGLALVAAILVALLGAVKAAPGSLFVPLVLVYAALILVAVRFSLASALTFERGRVDLFGSWRLTRGRFWPLLGTLALTFALAVVILVLGFVIVSALRLIVAGGDVGALFSRSGSASPGGLWTAPSLVAFVLNAIVTALIWPIMLTPAPEIYRVLKARGALEAP